MFCLVLQVGFDTFVVFYRKDLMFFCRVLQVGFDAFVVFYR